MPRIEQIPDDRAEVHPGDPVLLIIEDDPHYAKVLLDLARDKGFKGVVATRGTIGLALARQYQPTAISLDIFLPDMLGWSVLGHLTVDPTTRHIPVQILTIEEDPQQGLEHGAFAYVNKLATSEDLAHAFDRLRTFSTPHMKRLLVIEDNEAERTSIVELLGHDDVEITTVASGVEALSAMHAQSFDAIVLDLRLPDISGFELLERMQANPVLCEVPVVVFTGKELSDEEEAGLRRMAKSIVVKGVQSPERLLDETSLFLHRAMEDLPEAKRAMLDRLHASDEVLVDKKVLVVDDDVRNIFALSSVLEQHSMKVLSAGTGREAIEILESTPDLSLVLMDIMMPEMDGFETMRVIRQKPQLRRLPMIALTAKAMKGDREKCLEAGASDYIAKPVNPDQLVSLMRVWLHR